MSEIPAEFLEPELEDSEIPSVRDRRGDEPCRDPLTATQLDTADEPYGDG